VLLQESSVVDRKKYYKVEVEVGCLGRGKCRNKLLVVEGFMRWRSYSYQADRIAAN
jgi:hypothetical protein